MVKHPGPIIKRDLADLAKHMQRLSGVPDRIEMDPEDYGRLLGQAGNLIRFDFKEICANCDCIVLGAIAESPKDDRLVLWQCTNKDCTRHDCITRQRNDDPPPNWIRVL